MSKTAYEAFVIEVAAAIRVRRQAADLTLEDLAHEADMTVRHLHEIEKGRANPTLRSLFKISEALGIKVRDLLDEVERRPKSQRR